MDRIFKELPIVLPFYDYEQNQDWYRETVRDVNKYKLLSPRNAFLPFQLELMANAPKANKWTLIKQANGTIPGHTLDISENLHKIKVYTFADKTQALYYGDTISVGGAEMNLDCGFYHMVFEFPNGQKYFSEFFFIPENSFDAFTVSDFIRVEFWNNKDVEPVLYREAWKQVIYIDSFVNSFVPEIEEETEKDGYNNEYPTFQKMMLRYKFVDTVPDFIKIALISLQMQDVVYLSINQSRQGIVSRVIVTAQPHDTGGLNDVEVVFEDDVMYKNACQKNRTETGQTTW